MRKQTDELHLVNLANNMIGSTRLDLYPSGLLLQENAEVRDPKQWHQMLLIGPINVLRRKITEMNPETLACVAIFAEDRGQNRDHLSFRVTTLRAFLSGPQDTFGILRFGRIPSVITGTFGLRILKYLAELVLVGAMYDILMTELVVRAEPSGHSEGEPLPYSYEPKPAMERFVRQHRLNRKPTTSDRKA